jgi:lysozyme
MQISHNGLELVKDAEGFRDTAYKDTGGVWTIGYGTTRVDEKPVEQGMHCTEPQASLWLQSDMAAAQTCVNQGVKVPLTQNAFDALCSLCYNIGIAAFRSSTLLRLLNAGDYKGASAQFRRWDMDNGKHIPGLLSRRLRETSLFDT